MATRETRLLLFAQEVGTDIKNLVGLIGDAFSRTPPNGGTTGQVLAKTSDSNHAMAWVDPPEGGGASEPQITVSPTAPASPVENQLWLDIS